MGPAGKKVTRCGIARNKVALKDAGAKNWGKWQNFGVMTTDTAGIFFIFATWCSKRNSTLVKETTVQVF